MTAHLNGAVIKPRPTQSIVFVTIRRMIAEHAQLNEQFQDVEIYKRDNTSLVLRKGETETIITTEELESAAQSKAALAALIGEKISQVIGLVHPIAVIGNEDGEE